jgi:Na+-translocating ferredoxin:NAD+ oxidoreductase RnfE subunit
MSKENTIEEILESTKDIKKVDLNPYVFNKILLKIKLNKDVFLPTNLIWLSLCTFILLIFCNLILILKIDKISNKNEDTTSKYDLISYNINYQIYY